MKIPFLDRLRRREVIGMDIGTFGVKFVRLRRPVQSWFYPGSVLEDSERELPSLREFVRKNQLAGAAVACNIEDTSLKIRRIDLPKMPDYDLKEAVRWQLRDVVEGPVADFHVRYSVIEEYTAGETKKVSLVAYAIKKAVIQERVALLKKLLLDPVSIEPTSVSLLAAFDRLHGWQKGEFYGLIDFGEAKSVFTAMGEERLFFSRPLVGVSAHELRRLLQRELALGEEETEDLKRHLMSRRPMEGRFAELEKKAEAILPLLYTQLSIEIQRSLDAFFLMFHKEKIHRLLICGGGSMLPGLTDTLSRNLAVPTGLLDPTAAVPTTSESPCLYDVALGLALYPA